MPSVTSVLKKALIAVTAVGTLSFGVGAAGIGAAGPAGASTVALGPKAQAQADKHFEKHFDCANAARRLGHLQRVEARFAKTMSRLNKAEAKASKAGDTTMAAHWQKAMAHAQKVEAKVTGGKVKANTARRDAMITAKCHVAAPTSFPASTTST